MATLRYDFSIVGTKNIDRAFASIERRAVRHNIKMSREFGGTGRRSTNLRASGAAAATATRRRLSAEVAAERKATREKVRLDKWRQDMRNRHFQQNERMRRKEAAATQRASTRALAERKRAAGNIFGRAGRSAGGALRSTGTIVGGSLALGGALGSSAVAIKHEIVLAIIGGIFVLEAVSVIVQVASFKLTGKRVFRMAPVHHHFEKLGWAEPTIVIRFWIIAIILALIGLSTLKLR